MCDENCIVVTQSLPTSTFHVIPSKQVTTNNGVQSSSGLLVNNKHGLVITSSIIFSPYVDKSNWSMKETSQNGRGQQKLLYPPKNFKDVSISVIFHTNSPQTTHKFVTVQGKLLLLWRCEEFHDVINTMFSERDGWKLGDDEDDDTMKKRTQQRMSIEPVTLNCDMEAQHNLVSWFALLKLENQDKLKSIGTINPLTIYQSSSLHQGDALLACGTPFGVLCPAVFMNSLSTGIVTNLAGKDNALIVTDARAMPGTEGAGLYVIPHRDINKRKLVGLIVSPLCWKGNEWIGLTLACSITSLLESMHRLNRSQTQVSLPPSIFEDKVLQGSLSSYVKNALRAVVYVQVGPNWGSGVIVDQVKGYIITCRHVVKGSTPRRLRVLLRYPKRMWMAADVVFSTSACSPFDLAVLRLRHCIDGLQSVKPFPQVKKGQRVISVGHALFGFEIHPHPSVTSGIVSNVVRHNDKLVMIQSTCAVHAGASGGALLCADTGKLIGIIASNSRDVDSNESFPHVNFSLPTTCFWPGLQAYIHSEDINSLSYLNDSDPMINQLWLLDPNIDLNSKL